MAERASRRRRPSGPPPCNRPRSPDVWSFRHCAVLAGGRDDPLQLECSEPSFITTQPAAEQPRAASIPSTRGIRTSMSTTSEQGLSALPQGRGGGTAAELVVSTSLNYRRRAPAAAGPPSNQQRQRPVPNHRGTSTTMTTSIPTGSHPGNRFPGRGVSARQHTPPPPSRHGRST